ncbi:MAG: hypothetical protein Q7R83_04295 [bacterium]|nr:hypothetical protein [bacterium]
MYKIFVRWHKNQFGETDDLLNTVELFQDAHRVAQRTFVHYDNELLRIYCTGLVEGLASTGASIAMPTCLSNAWIDKSRED